MSIKSIFQKIIGRFVADEDANPTVEFVIAAPVIFAIVFSVFEAGWLMTQQTRLDSGLNLAVRDLRIGLTVNPTHDDIKTLICDHSLILKDCETSLQLEMVNSSSAAASANPTCVDHVTNIEPVLDFDVGSRENPEIMLLRACFVVKPLMPGAGLGSHFVTNASGEVSIISFSAFANEPL